MKTIKIITVIIIFFITTCHKFEENILLFKNIDVFLNSTTWELVSFSKDGQIILKKEKIKIPYYAFNKEGKKYYLLLVNFDTTISKDRLVRWEILKMNSKKLKLKYMNTNSNVFIQNFIAVEYKKFHLTYE